MRLIEILKNQLQSEGHKVTQNKIGSELEYISFLTLTEADERPMQINMFFTLDGEKLKTTKAFSKF